MKINTNDIYEFADRLGYISTNNLPDNIIVDHVNKEYNIEYPIYYVLFDIILWNTPTFVYNILKTSLKNCFNYSMTDYHLVEAVLFIDDIVYTTKYRNSNLYKILHPCIDFTLRTNFTKVIEILFCKVFDEKDNYFNSNYHNVKTINRPNIFTEEQYMFLESISNIDVVLSGSLAMSMYGSVYRTNIKDFDLLVDYKHLPDDILEIINDKITHNKIVGKDRFRTEEEIKDKFINSDFFSKLNKIFYYKLKVISAVIDRTTEYDNITKLTFVIKYNNIEFDLIFRDNIKYELFYMPICDGLGNIINGCKVKVQDINDILYAKKLLERPKDFQDLINFKPYTRLNNNGKCVVKYD